MGSTAVHEKRKILFDAYFPEGGNVPAEFESEKFQRRFQKLRHDMVRTVFIVTRGVSDSYKYLRFMKEYERRGFLVKSIYLPDLSPERIEYVRNTVREMVDSFRDGSTLVISYGPGYAGVVIASYILFSGGSVGNAVKTVRMIHPSLLDSEEERRFLSLYREKTGTGTEDEKEVSEKPEKPESPHRIDIPAERPVRETAVKPEKTVINEMVENHEQAVEQEVAVSRREELIPEVKPVVTEQPVYTPVEETVLPETEPEVPVYDEEVSAPEPVEDQAQETAEALSEEVPVEEPLPVPAKKEKRLKKKEKKEKRARKKVQEDSGVEKEETISQDSVKKGFGGFFTSIQFKLIFIISLIIILSLTGMIFLATYYFVKDNRVRIQESNHEVSSLLSLKVRSDFLSILDHSRRATEVLLEKSRGGRVSVQDMQIAAEKDFIFSGIAKKDAVTGELVFTETIMNTPLMAQLQISEDNLKAVYRTHSSVFSRSFNGDTIVQNVSETLQIPVMGISYPIQIQGAAAMDSIGVSYFRLDEILKAFRGDQGISKGVNVFMVNDRGQVIAHPDSSLVLSAQNFINLPIVKNMMKSPMNNGQTRYTDANGTVFLGSFRKIGIGGCGVIATVEEAKALQAVYDLQRRNIYLTVIILAMVIMVVFFFGKSLTTPIVRLVGATKKIQKGQYQVDIEPVSRDEIGELTASFIEMGKGLEEREKMKDAFGKFVNQEIADQVLKGELHLGGERKVAAVFFSDIRSFTAISEKMEPEEVVEFLNEYMTRMVGCVNDTFGVVDKFIGDAIMAIWGTPVSRGNDTENAVNAALMMRKELLEFNKDRGGDKKPIIQIGCGINTGPVLAGQIGSNDRMEYTVIGDTVNLASRIEALNKPFGTDILISEDSYELVKDLYRMEPMQKIKVKGKEDTQQIYAVLGKIDDPEAPKNIEELRRLLGIDMTGKAEGEYSEEAEKKYEILA